MPARGSEMKQFHTVGAACLLGVLAGTASGQLNNTGFETLNGTPPPLFAGGWLDFGGPAISQDLVTFLNGAASAKLTGQNTGGNNTTILQQSILLGVDPGDLFIADLFAQQLSSDPIMVGSAGFASIEALNGVGGILEITTAPIGSAGGPLDSWENFNWFTDMPTGAAAVRLTLGYFQNALETGSVYIDDANLDNLGPAPSSLLLNPSFDTFVPTAFQPTAGNFPRWTLGGGNIFQNPDFPRTGVYALLMFGTFEGVENTQVLSQDLPATPGNLYDFSGFMGHITGDTLAGDNIAFFQVEFLDAGSNTLNFTRTDVLDSSNAPDIHFPGQVLATAPVGTTTVRVLCGFFQDFAQSGGAAHIDDVSLTDLGPNNGLINPGFETFELLPDFSLDPLGPVPGWELAGFNNDAGNPNIGQNELSDEGRLSAFLFGQFNGSANSTAIFQELSIAENYAGGGTAQVELTLLARHETADPIGPSNSVLAVIDYLDTAGGTVLSTTDVVALNSGSTLDTWLPVSVTAAAPVGAETVRVTVVYNQDNDDAGAAFIDDVAVAFSMAPSVGGACCFGCFDDNMNGPDAADLVICRDGVTAVECELAEGKFGGVGSTCADIPSPCDQFCQGDVLGDNNGDTSLADFTELANNFGLITGSRLDGDHDCDGDVDLSDFTILANNFGCVGVVGHPGD
jgi:hypothetical protein